MLTMGVIVCKWFSCDGRKWRWIATKWKSSLEAKGLKVYVNTTKMMFGGKCNNASVGHGKYPRGVRNKGVCGNLILCTACDK